MLKDKASTQTPAKFEVAKSSDDFYAIKKTVEDAASVSASIWLSYLFALFYFYVALIAITHADLLLENAVKLPFLNIELPIISFFVLAPILFVVLHAYTLVHFVILGTKASRFHETLYRLFPERDFLARESIDVYNEKIRTGFRRQLPGNIFVQLLAGPNDIRDGTFGLLLKSIMAITLVAAPISLLILFEIQFIPYHSEKITWLHRTIIIIDLLLLVWLWGRIGSSHASPSVAMRAIALTLRAIAASFVIVFSLFIATLPNEKFAKPANDYLVLPTKFELPNKANLSSFSEFYAWLNALETESIHVLLFEGDVDEITHKRKSMFSNTIVLPYFDIYSAIKADGPEKVAWKEHLLELSGRHLEGAVFDNAKIPKANLNGAILVDASLVGTELAGSDLGGAIMHGAGIHGTKLAGSSLRGAQMQGATIIIADLRGADLASAQMQGVALIESQLQAADLEYADLSGSYNQIAENNNIGTDFSGAFMEGVNLQGAMALNSIMHATDLTNASIWRAELDGTQLENIMCSGMSLYGKVYDDSSEDVKVKAWDQEYYNSYVNSIRDSLKDYSNAEQVLNNIKILDCGKSDVENESITPCGLSPAYPATVKDYQKALNATCLDLSNSKGKEFLSIHKKN